MAKLAEARSSAIEFDGSAILMPQLASVALSGSAQTGKQVVPWNTTIEKTYVIVHTTSTLTDVTLSLGTTASSTAYLNAYVLTTNTAGQIEIPAASYVTTAVAAGTQFIITLGTGATAVVSVLTVLSPMAGSTYT